MIGETDEYGIFDVDKMTNWWKYDIEWKSARCIRIT